MRWLEAHVPQGVRVEGGHQDARREQRDEGVGLAAVVQGDHGQRAHDGRAYHCR